jgi:hypothetical protein
MRWDESEQNSAPFRSPRGRFELRKTPWPQDLTWWDATLVAALWQSRFAEGPSTPSRTDQTHRFTHSHPVLAQTVWQWSVVLKSTANRIRCLPPRRRLWCRASECTVRPLTHISDACHASHCSGRLRCPDPTRPSQHITQAECLLNRRERDVCTRSDAGARLCMPHVHRASDRPKRAALLDACRNT